METVAISSQAKLYLCNGKRTAAAKVRDARTGRKPPRRYMYVEDVISAGR